MSKQMIIMMTVIVLMGSISLTFGYSQKETSPAVPDGIVLSRKPVNIAEAWSLCQNLKWIDPGMRIENQKMIDELLGNISENCYNISVSGNIKPRLDNRFADIYFVPSIKQRGKDLYMKLYGAILYEEKEFKGKCQLVYKHLVYTGGVFMVEHQKITIPRVSSIKLFELVWGPNPDWGVTVYRKIDKISYSLQTMDEGYHHWYRVFDLPLLPESIQINGNLLAILMKPNGESEIFVNKANGKLLNSKKPVKLIPQIGAKLIIVSAKLI